MRYPRGLVLCWCLLPVAAALGIWAWYLIAGPWGALGSAAFVSGATTGAAVWRHQQNMKIAAKVRANLDIIEIEQWLREQ